jgi:formylglycine-generating enzyme required for sulfatase activity
MSSLAMRAAIVEPARVRGVDFESEELVDKLVKAGLDGSLPLLQFALAELWEARTPGSSTLRQRDLEKIDGVSGALARHADGVLTQLTVAQRRAARDLLLRLVTMDETRASLPRRELLGGSKDAAIALEAFVEARLIHIRDGDDGYPVHELAHETLIRDWVSLRVWLSEEKDTRELRCHLEHAAGEWERLERPSDGLWDGALLDEARRIDHEELTPRERDFLAQSAAHVRRRSRLRLGLLVGVPSVIAVSLTVGILLQRASQDQLINGHVEAAQALITQAHANNEAVDADRSSAFAAFDRGATSEGEELWQRARRSADEVRRTYTRAASHLETAFGVDPLREDTCALLTEVLLERARLAERDHRADSIEGLLLRAALYDRDGSGMARWLRPAQVRVFAPLNVEIAVQRYDRSQSPYVLEDTLDRIPRDAELKLAPGSYLWTFRADGDEPILLPLVLRRGESLELRVELSPDDVIPPGFIYVPAGEFLYGSDDDDDLRRSFFTAEPMHNVKTEHYLVSRFETTNAEWIEFLDARTPEELELRTPRSEAAAFQAAPVLTKSARGGWEIERRTGERIDRAGAGALLRVDGREGIDAYDWLQLPVTGISMVDAEAYLAWLNSSGKLPGARLCSEHEWERAARGADGRMFPHGDALAPSEANIDTTYGRLPSAFAPDVVASHPESRSPFGVDDAAGNVWEWVAPAPGTSGGVARGGSFFHGAIAARAANRSVLDRSFRDGTLGLRVCVTPEPAFRGIRVRSLSGDP